MVTKQQAKFVGHGIGLQINELPVLTPRSERIIGRKTYDLLLLDPSLLFLGTGAVGVRISYLVTNNAVEKLTLFEENIIQL